MGIGNIVSSREVYVNPFTDFGFKRLFGEEPNKDLLIDFLNEVLRNESSRITDITYLNTEHLGPNAKDRKAIFDIYCENEVGEKFIVELQKGKQKYFKDRALYYTSSAVQSQAQRGDWSFELQAVYTIAILDFEFENGKGLSDKYRTDVQLVDVETGKVFYKKLRFIYFEMPKFTKSLDDLENHYEKWLYVLRHLHYLDTIPDKLRERIFEHLFEVAEVSNFTPEQRQSYEDSVKSYRDLKNTVDTAREEGRMETRIKIAMGMLEEGLDIGTIVRVTDLSEEEIESIKKEQDS